MNRIIVPYALLRTAIGQAITRPQRRSTLFGDRRWDGDDIDLLLRGDETGGALPVIVGLSSNPVIEVASEAPAGDFALLLITLEHAQPGRRYAAVLRDGGRRRRIDALRIIGPGIQEIVGGSADPAAIDPAAALRWSRTIGAMQAENWNLMTGLAMGIIGLGRTGTIMADALYRLGVRRLTLIDPDKIERHNLGEMGIVNAGDLAQSKAVAVARALVAGDAADPGAGERTIRAVERSITDFDAFDAARRCDLLICSVDHDSARMTAAAIGVLYHRPLLDIATGILLEDGQRQMGADIRLTLPGRCLMCAGGLRNVDEARRVLASAAAEREFRDSRDWRSERAGSLASLNLLASSLALRLLEDWIAGRVEETTWIHVEIDTRGRADIRYPPLDRPREPCALCTLSGRGDSGLRLLRDVLQGRR